jgi:peptide/nickel transport system permease protein
MTEAETAVPAVEERKAHSLLVDLAIRLLKEKPLGAVGLAIVMVLFIAGIFADWLTPYGMNDVDMSVRLLPPSGTFILGTDNLGRDLLTRIIFGARVSLIVGLSATAISVTTATLLGIISGFFGGKTDLIIQRLVDAWMCFPGLVILLTVLSITGPGMLQVIFILGILSGITGSRVVRSAVIGIRENAYVDAARAIGAQPGKILTKHILPNIMPVIIVSFTIGIGGMILAEASLSFLGFGIPAPIPSWGGMLSGAGRAYMYQAPWMMLWPGVALAITIYGMNMLGDAVRDLLDPRLRGGLGRYSVATTKRQKLLKRRK